MACATDVCGTCEVFIPAGCCRSHLGSSRGSSPRAGAPAPPPSPHRRVFWKASPPVHTLKSPQWTSAFTQAWATAPGRPRQGCPRLLLSPAHWPIPAPPTTASILGDVGGVLPPQPQRLVTQQAAWWPLPGLLPQRGLKAEGNCAVPEARCPWGQTPRRLSLLFVQSLLAQGAPGPASVHEGQFTRLEPAGTSRRA